MLKRYTELRVHNKAVWRGKGDVYTKALSIRSNQGLLRQGAVISEVISRQTKPLGFMRGVL